MAENFPAADGREAFYRILVTGSRTFEDQATLEYELEKAVAEACRKGRFGPACVVIVHGACPSGADAMADAAALRLGCQVERHPAQWSLGRSAGFKRNAEMVKLGADLCLAFLRPCSQLNCAQGGEHYSHGADHCSVMAAQNGIEVRRFTSA